MNYTAVEYLVLHFNEKVKELVLLNKKAVRARKIENKINIYKDIYAQSSGYQRIIEDIEAIFKKIDTIQPEPISFFSYQIDFLNNLKSDSLSMIDSLSELL